MTSCRVAAQTRLTLINRGTAYHKFIEAKSRKVGNMMGIAVLEMGGRKLDEDVCLVFFLLFPLSWLLLSVSEHQRARIGIANNQDIEQPSDDRIDRAKLKARVQIDGPLPQFIRLDGDMLRIVFGFHRL